MILVKPIKYSLLLLLVCISVFCYNTINYNVGLCNKSNEDEIITNRKDYYEYSSKTAYVMDTEELATIILSNPYLTYVLNGENKGRDFQLSKKDIIIKEFLQRADAKRVLQHRFSANMRNSARNFEMNFSEQTCIIILINYLDYKSCIAK